MKTFPRYSIALLWISAAFLGSCGKSGKAPQEATSNRVTEFELSDVDALNPLNSTTADATYMEEQMFQRLIGIDVNTMTYTVPVLAESMPTISADHLQYDFILRKDVKWADGKPLTGADVIFSLKALKNPFNVLSAQKRNYVDAIHSAELIDGDPYRVRFKFWKSYVLAMQAAFGDVLYIIPKHILDPNNLTDKYSWDDIGHIIENTGGKEVDSATLAKHKNLAMQEYADWFANADRQRLPQYIQGSGPYKLDAWVTQQYIRLVRNPNYVNHWGPAGEASPDTLVYKTILDFPAAVTALKARNIDLIGRIQPQYWNSIDTGKTGLKRVAFPLGAFSYIGFNNRNVIFRDLSVRWAMAYMIDRRLIIEKLLYGQAKLTESPHTSTHPEYNHDLPLIQYDPQRAEKILDSLDWKDHDGDGIRDKMIDGRKVPFHFTFTTNNGNETRKKVLLIFSEALRKIGIEAEVQTLDWSVYIDRLRDHLLDAHMGEWVNDPFEADSYQLYHSSQAKNRGSNYDAFNNAEADKLLTEIRSEFDDAKRLAMQKQLQKILYDQQANLFLWEPLNLAAWVDRFDNVTWNSYRPGFNIAWWKIRAAGGGTKASPQ